MNVRQALLGLIAVTTAVLVIAHLIAQGYTAAGISALIGIAWLALVANQQTRFSSVYFAALVMLAAVGSLTKAPLPLLLIGLSTDLAAWDLARFIQRLKAEPEPDHRTPMEQQHLRKLALVAGAGLVLALLPALNTLSLSFVVLLAIMLLLLVLLRQSIVALRRNA